MKRVPLKVILVAVLCAAAPALVDAAGAVTYTAFGAFASR